MLYSPCRVPGEVGKTTPTRKTVCSQGPGEGSHHAGKQPIEGWDPSKGTSSPRLQHRGRGGAGERLRRPRLGTVQPPPGTTQGTPHTSLTFMLQLPSCGKEKPVMANALQKAVPEDGM